MSDNTNNTKKKAEPAATDEASLHSQGANKIERSDVQNDMFKTVVKAKNETVLETRKVSGGGTYSKERESTTKVGAKQGNPKSSEKKRKIDWELCLLFPRY